MPVRLGGKVFVIFLVNRPPTQVPRFAERMRKAIRASAWTRHGDVSRDVRVSLGAAVPMNKESLRQLVRRADEALYQVKADGRDRACEARRMMPVCHANIFQPSRENPGLTARHLARIGKYPSAMLGLKSPHTESLPVLRFRSR